MTGLQRKLPVGFGVQFRNCLSKASYPHARRSGQGKLVTIDMSRRAVVIFLEDAHYA